MRKPGLLQIGPVPDRMRLRFEAEWQVTRLFDYEEGDRLDFLARAGGQFTGIATSGHWGVPADIMAALPNLKVISSNGVGYDTIDAAAAAARGVLVSHTPDVLNDDVADTAILLWLALTRHLLQGDRWVRSGDWATHGSYPLTRSVRGQVMGILGLGRIGRTIATRAEAFGAKIVYHGRTKQVVPYEFFASLTDMAAACDVLVCVTPGGPETQHLVGADVLRALGPEGALINVARGSVVDETALIAALDSGALGGAGLDVFEHEPNVPAALTERENVVLAPHMASGTIETRQAMGDLVCDNLSRFLVDGRVLTPVPECADLRTGGSV